jgi:peptidyl-prolyl cis-trans isomerase C
MLAPAAAAQPAPVTVPPDRVVIKAGDVTITEAQYDEIINGLPDQVKNRFRANRKQFAEILAKLYILSDEARRRKLDQTPGYKIQATLNNDQLLSNLVSDEIKAETKIDEADARKYYDEHLRDFEEVTARHILIRTKGAQMPVKPGAKELTDEEALAKANDLYKRITAGEDFATLAKENSDDSTASNGGLLPPFPHNRMVPTFDQEAFKLKPGEVSAPVKTQYGYHIIKVESHVTKTFEQARPQIEKTLVPQKAQKTLEEMTKSAFYDPDFFAAPKPPAPPTLSVPPAAAKQAAPVTPAAPPVTPKQ